MGRTTKYIDFDKLIRMRFDSWILFLVFYAFALWVIVFTLMRTWSRPCNVNLQWTLLAYGFSLAAFGAGMGIGIMGMPKPGNNIYAVGALGLWVCAITLILMYSKAIPRRCGWLLCDISLGFGITTLAIPLATMLFVSLFGVPRWMRGLWSLPGIGRIWGDDDYDRPLMGRSPKLWRAQNKQPTLPASSPHKDQKKQEDEKSAWMPPMVRPPQDGTTGGPGPAPWATSVNVGASPAFATAVDPKEPSYINGTTPPQQGRSTPPGASPNDAAAGPESVSPPVRRHRRQSPPRSGMSRESPKSLNASPRPPFPGKIGVPPTPKSPVAPPVPPNTNELGGDRETGQQPDIEPLPDMASSSTLAPEDTSVLLIPPHVRVPHVSRTPASGASTVPQVDTSVAPPRMAEHFLPVSGASNVPQVDTTGMPEWTAEPATPFADAQLEGPPPSMPFYPSSGQPEFD